MSKDAILTIETSTSQCSVAIRDTSGDRRELIKIGSNVHSKVVLPLIKQLLDETGMSLKDLSAIGVCRGPGSFTGLRIGIGVAQGLAYGANLPMFGFSSLDILLAQQVELDEWIAKEQFVVAALDARMQEVYWTTYALEQGRPINGEIKVSRPQSVELPDDFDVLKAHAEGRLTVLGNAWAEYPELSQCMQLPLELAPSNDSEQQLLPLACGLINLYERYEAQGASKGLLESASDFAPLYVRNDVAAKPKASIKTGSAVI